MRGEGAKSLGQNQREKRSSEYGTTGFPGQLPSFITELQFSAALQLVFNVQVYALSTLPLRILAHCCYHLRVSTAFRRPPR